MEINIPSKAFLEQREYGDMAFGLLIRRTAKLDHDAAMEAFSKFINDESLNQRQIAFVNKIINHVEKNGYMESVSVLQKPPFDKPESFIKVFDPKTREELIKTINGIRYNAEHVIAWVGRNFVFEGIRVLCV